MSDLIKRSVYLEAKSGGLSEPKDVSEKCRSSLIAVRPKTNKAIKLAYRLKTE